MPADGACDTQTMFETVMGQAQEILAAGQGVKKVVDYVK